MPAPGMPGSPRLRPLLSAQPGARAGSEPRSQSQGPAAIRDAKKPAPAAAGPLLGGLGPVPAGGLWAAAAARPRSEKGRPGGAGPGPASPPAALGEVGSGRDGGIRASISAAPAWPRRARGTGAPDERRAKLLCPKTPPSPAFLLSPCSEVETGQRGETGARRKPTD